MNKTASLFRPLFPAEPLSAVVERQQQIIAGLRAAAAGEPDRIRAAIALVSPPPAEPDLGADAAVNVQIMVARGTFLAATLRATIAGEPERISAAVLAEQEACAALVLEWGFDGAAALIRARCVPTGADQSNVAMPQHAAGASVMSQTTTERPTANVATVPIVKEFIDQQKALLGELQTGSPANPDQISQQLLLATCGATEQTLNACRRAFSLMPALSYQAWLDAQIGQLGEVGAAYKTAA